MTRFDPHPCIELNRSYPVTTSWSAILDLLGQRLRPDSPVLIDCYHGVLLDDLLERIAEHLPGVLCLDTREAMHEESHIREMVHPDVTDDRVFGRLTELTLSDFFDPERIQAVNRRMAVAEHGTILVGPGAALVSRSRGTLIYADMARWEIQQRQRARLIDNLGVSNRHAEDWMPRYKQGYFVDWRVLDAHKRTLFDSIDFLLDTNTHEEPKLVPHEAILEAYDVAVTRPFSLAPFFDPGPWGGQWMKSTFGLPENGSNYAWCFNCVPEENSLLVRINGITVELPAINLVFRHPEKLLGTHVHGRFGAEFPIRFDYLDTVGGGNLSLQVHPTADYIRRQFNMPYTQDESYYLLDAEPDARVYLGFREDVDPSRFLHELRVAQQGSEPFDAERHVQTWSVKQHDHVQIPAGTIHCSGRGCMVLEISATPYIFTFKLWDWGRLGLDGTPRPIHLDHGEQVLDWTRRTEWTRANLLAEPVPVAAGDGWSEERTGLHSLEFIETRRHWFHAPVLHSTGDTVQVLALVQGAQIRVDSPTGAFAPFHVRYGEVFIVPAAVGTYRVTPISPNADTPHATLKAFVRNASP